MAVEDSGLLEKGWKIELIPADHQNKPNVGVNVGRQWVDVERSTFSSISPLPASALPSPTSPGKRTWST